MLYLGIDPGRFGAVYALENGREQHKDFDKSSDMDLYLFFLMMKIQNPEYACGVEFVQARPTDGVVQAFTFGRHMQRIKTILTLAGIEYHWVPAQKWQNYLGWGRLPRGKQNYKARKKELHKIAKEMTDYDGLTLDNCDAYLITKYLEMTNKNK
jgi:hypothetical protein